MSARWLGLVLVLGACGAPGDEPALEPAEARGALVGGREVSSAEFPATVLINDGCTGAKVGPRLFITAAHCVHDSERNTVPVGGLVRVTTKRAQVRSGDYLDLDLVDIHVMQGWLDACQAPCGANVLSAAHPSDVALFEVAEDSPDIREAYVDISPVLPGDALVEVGYGCEDGYGIAFDYANRRLKVEQVVALPAGSLLHEGSYVWQGDEVNIAASYVITPGLAHDGASLCPGDSGGPLYRDDATQRRVVGINAYYTFPPGSGVATTNWHTRVDDESRYGVATWLSERGANVVDGCLPLCEQKSCGDDGCGGSCGSCAENEACAEGQCLCVPSCAGKTCGDDGCGGSCGECEPDAGQPPETAPDAGEDEPEPADDEGEDAPEVETNIDEATAGEGDFCADHPGTPECAVVVTGKGCQLAPGGRKGEPAAYLLFFALLWLRRRWRRPARAANLAS
jgi:hypothetical protein